MGTFVEKPVHPKDRAIGQEPSSSKPTRDTVHTQTTDPAFVPGGSAKVDDEGVIHIGAVNDPDA